MYLLSNQKIVQALPQVKTNKDFFYMTKTLQNDQKEIIHFYT